MIFGRKAGRIPLKSIAPSYREPPTESAPPAARFAGHRFADRPDPSPTIVEPGRNSTDYILQGVFSDPDLDDLVTRQFAQFPKKPIEVVGSQRTAMQDWDWPDDHHIAKQAITIKNLGDVYDSMKKFTSDNPEELWKVYVTPGGVRAFDMANRRPTVQALDLANKLGSDPLYAQLSDSSRRWYSRISPKAGREGDFVAVPIGTMGQGTPLAANMDYVRRFHDVPIMENRIVSGQIHIPETGLRLLEDQAATLPDEARPMIDPLMSRIYAALARGQAT